MHETTLIKMEGYEPLKEFIQGKRNNFWSFISCSGEAIT